jgi:hypothetical protein
MVVRPKIAGVVVAVLTKSRHGVPVRNAEALGT